VPATAYFTCRLVINEPFDSAIVAVIAKNYGFATGVFTEDVGNWARAGDFMVTTNESSQSVLQSRVSALVNFLRSSGHAPNTGAFDIKPAGT